MDVNELCRGCSKEVSSWEKNNFNEKVVEMFCFCTNLEVTAEDNLPKNCCNDCITKIESAYTFIHEAHKVDITLRNIISRGETSIIVETENQRNSFEIQLNLEDKLYTDDILESVHEEYYEISDRQNVDISKTTEELSSNNINNSETVTKCGVLKKICPNCQKEFTSQTWFVKHLEKEHSDIKHRCNVCYKSFSKQYQLKLHSVCHSNERKHHCPQCGKTYKLRKQLATHMHVHNDDRPFACTKCDLRFKIRSVLKSHMKLHDNDKKFLCSFCGWSFAEMGNLTVHVRTHTGEKPHACTECGFRAAAASSLRRHQRRHAGARVYVCNHCRKGFYDSSALVRHMRTHTGELPYRCGVCARRFADAWKRKRHLAHHHQLPLHHIPRLDKHGDPLHM